MPLQHPTLDHGGDAVAIDFRGGFRRGCWMDQNRLRSRATTPPDFLSYRDALDQRFRLIAALGAERFHSGPSPA